MKPAHFINAILLISAITLNSGCTYSPSKSKGELSFYRNNEVLKKIAIEAILTNEWHTQQDLILHNITADSCGMLFIFEDPIIQPFRMNNKPQSFDIIFVAPNNKIVIIQKNVPSISSQLLPSDNDILYNYVVIVNAGFCNTYSISEDDSVSFHLTDKKS